MRPSRRLVLLALAVSIPVAACAGPRSPSPPSPDPVVEVVDDAADDVADATALVARVRSTDPVHVVSSTTLDAPTLVGEAGMTTTLDAVIGWRANARDGTYALERLGGPADRAGLRARLVDDRAWVRSATEPWIDAGPVPDRWPMVSHLRSVDEVVDLVERALGARELRSGEAGETETWAWRGVVPTPLAAEWATRPGGLGQVTRMAAGVPAAGLEDVFAFEVAERLDGGVRLSVWVDADALGAVDAPGWPLDGDDRFVLRTDTVWRPPTAGIDLDPPESVANRN